MSTVDTVAHTRVNKREAQRLATRELLFSRAVAEFGKTGVAGADVGAIVAAAGVAHGTFFFHFPTKEHVVAELGQREEVRMAKELDRYLEKPRDLRSALKEFIRLMMAMERRIGRPLHRDLLAIHFSPGRSELRLWPEHPVVARLIVAFERARERGEIDRGADPANSVLIFFLGLFGVLLTHDEEKARDSMLELLVTTTVRALDPRLARLDSSDIHLEQRA